MPTPRHWSPAAFLALALATIPACKPKAPPTVPARISEVRAHSEISPEADALIEALAAGDCGRIQATMTPQLRDKVPLTDLEVAGAHLAETFGAPLGIMEEHTHTEGDLLWYSGLVAHATEGGTGVVAPVLYQFALTRERKLARLLIREHWFMENLEAPADRYLPITRFHPPFRGTATISHGGPTRATNYHHGSRGQRFAYDIVVKEDGRARRPGAKKSRNDAYYIYGRPVLAPAAGVVIRAINDVPDNRPGTRGRAGGNGVIIDHGFSEYSSVWHAIPGSVRVSVGDYVEAGQQVARVGNSGRSTGPHIHMHVTNDPNSPRHFGLPAPFVDVYVNDRWRDRVMPVRHDEVRGAVPNKAKRQARGPRVLLDV
jgi:hypothetical protein